MSDHNAIAGLIVKTQRPGRPPGFSITILTILLPVFLMLARSASDLFTKPHARLHEIFHFTGNTDIALALATVISFYVLGLARGFSRETILRFTNESPARLP